MPANRTDQSRPWAPSKTGVTTTSEHPNHASCATNLRSCATRPANPATRCASNSLSTDSAPPTPRHQPHRILVILTNIRNHRITTTVKHGVLRAVDRPLLRLHGARVTAIRCPACNSWVKPRRFLTPAMVCQACVPAVQPPIHRRPGAMT